ncbi:MAG: Lrp/AsnC family transcriptional regulator [Promethearchaeota archaeon]
MKIRDLSALTEETDVKILKVLLSEAKLSNRQIAKRVGVSVNTVISRIRKMEEKRIIKGYTAVLDHEMLGYDLTVITEITVSEGRLLEMEKEIAKIPNVCAVYDVTGLIDAIVVAKFRNREELSKFTKGLLALPFIERTNTHLVLTTVKEEYKMV